jgi:multicomponent Na+:H+ antiporter subunit F
LAENILIVAAILIFFGIALGVLRLILGHTVVDRVAAVDMLTILSISLIALYAHVANRFIYLDVALVYGVLSFLVALAIARHLEGGL